MTASGCPSTRARIKPGSSAIPVYSISRSTRWRNSTRGPQSISPQLIRAVHGTVSPHRARMPRDNRQPHRGHSRLSPRTATAPIYAACSPEGMPITSENPKRKGAIISAAIRLISRNVSGRIPPLAWDSHLAGFCFLLRATGTVC